MILMTNKKYRSTCCLFASLAIVLSSLVPTGFAFALYGSCGSHEIEICDEHDQSHFKLTHTKSDTSVHDRHEPEELAKRTIDHSSETHEHHIESDPILKIDGAKYRIHFPSFSLAIASDYFYSALSETSKLSVISFDPPDLQTPLYLLKCVRLII